MKGSGLEMDKKNKCRVSAWMEMYMGGVGGLNTSLETLSFAQGFLLSL